MPPTVQRKFDSSVKQRFGVDLVPLAKQHIQFLKRLHERGISFTKLSEESLRRYQELWLPLVFRYPQENLIPPDDIAWLWHCHRLAPHRYQAYLKRTFGTDCPILDARPAFRMQSDDDHFVTHDEDQTKELWEAVYPNEPFLMSNEKGPHSMKEDTHTTEGVRENLLDGFDLLEATERQATFLWQISGPRFSDTAFLEEGLINYYKFLLLKRDASSEIQIIVPTYQIDLMWHTHMLSGLKGYFEDCQRIIGSVLYHDDNISDRSEGSALNVAFTEMNCLWKERYGQDYNVLGGMYRGEPPVGYYSADWSAASEIDSIPMRPYLRYVNVQGASSAVPDADSTKMTPTVSTIKWCWKEEFYMLGLYAPGSIVGDPSDCWVSYNAETNNILEAAFLANGGTGKCKLIDGYTVDFDTMIQTEESTGSLKFVQRLTVQTSEVGGPTSSEALNGTPSEAPNGTLDETLAPTEVVERWTPPWGLMRDGNPAFIPAKTDYHTVENLANLHLEKNPRKKYYIFGKECRGWGYYHVTTREAYKILSIRLKDRVAEENNDLVRRKSRPRLLCCGPSQNSIVLQEAELDALRLIHTIVAARSKLEVPVGVVGIRPDTLGKPGIVRNHYSHDGHWHFPEEYYVAGGGCGARADSGFNSYLFQERVNRALEKEGSKLQASRDQEEPQFRGTTGFNDDARNLEMLLASACGGVAEPNCSGGNAQYPGGGCGGGGDCGLGGGGGGDIGFGGGCGGGGGCGSVDCNC